MLSTVQKPARHLLPELFHSPSLPTLLIICSLAIAAAAFMPLVQSSIATSTNGNVHRMEQVRDDWQARIQELELEVATMAGLERIENASKTDLKMIEPKETKYITVAAAAPEPRRLPNRYLPPTADERQTEPSIWDKILDWLPLP